MVPQASAWGFRGQPATHASAFFTEWGEEIVDHHTEDCGSDTSVDKTGHKENEMGIGKRRYS